MVLFFKRHPAVWVLLFFVLGLWIRSYWSEESVNWLVVGVVTLSLFVVLCIVFGMRRIYQCYSFRWLFGVISGILLVLLGYCVSALRETCCLTVPFDGSFIGVVDEVQGKHSSTLRLSVVLEQIGERVINDHQVPVRVMCYVARRDSFVAPQVGSVILGAGRFQPLSRVAVPYQFDYGKYLFHQGYSMTCRVRQIEKVNAPEYIGISGFGNLLRNRFVGVFEQALPNDSLSSVVKALVLGDRTSLDPSLRDDYVRAGAIHVLAVSGLHVGIIYLFLMFALSLLGNNYQWVRLLLGLVVLWGYAWLTRFSPSVSRATIMFSVLLFGQILGQKASLFNSLALSAFLILLVWPSSFYMPGFWLSHLAVAGIGIFYLPINNFLSFRFIGWRWLWSMVSVSLAAQVGTFPLMLWMFHGFPVYFVLSNVLILPVVPIVLGGALVLLVLPVGGFMSLVVSGLVSGGVEFMNGSTQWVSGLPGAYLEGLSLTHFELVATLGGCLLLGIFLSEARLRLLISALVMFVFVLVSVGVRRIVASRQLEVHFYTQGTKKMMNVIDGYHNFVLTDGRCSIADAAYVFQGLWAMKMVEAPMMLDVDDLVNSHGLLRLPMRDKEVFVLRKTWRQKLTGDGVVIWSNQSVEEKRTQLELCVVERGVVFDKFDVSMVNKHDAEFAHETWASLQRQKYVCWVY
ncbi:MAG: ComEC/Rec2 family competence protein [Marinilabiliaceae bacterium]|nr:ComEC/Rec2 family competence protein [Marinilabiliaceae bacterium]